MEDSLYTAKEAQLDFIYTQGYIRVVEVMLCARRYLAFSCIISFQSRLTYVNQSKSLSH